ncbi:C-X-C motif chemokine 16 [Discoglossus pictus]
MSRKNRIHTYSRIIKEPGWTGYRYLYTLYMDCRKAGVGMWVLILTTALLAQPGFCQFGVNMGRFCSCTKLMTEPSPILFKTYRERVKKYEDCPNNIVRFTLLKGDICAHNTDEWVKNLKKCISNGENVCLKSFNPDFQQDYSKGSDKANSKIPTTRPVLQTTRFLNLPEEVTTTPISITKAGRYDVTSWESTSRKNTISPHQEVHTLQDSRKLQDVDHATLASDVKSKMDSSKVAIMSLLLISFVLVITVTVMCCRKKKGNGSNTFTNIMQRIKYKQTPMTDMT